MIITTPLMLAQSSQLPPPNKGTRVIIDEHPKSSVKTTEASLNVPASTFYWIGAIVLFFVAIMMAASFLKPERKSSKIIDLGKIKVDPKPEHPNPLVHSQAPTQQQTLTQSHPSSKLNDN